MTSKQTVEKKRITLRAEDQEIFRATVNRDEGGQLIVHLNIHKKIEEIFQEANPAGEGSGDKYTIRNRNGFDYYRIVPPGLEKVLELSRTELSASHPELQEVTTRFTQYGFDPGRLYLGESQLNFQALRQVGLSHEDGITIKVEGAITMSLLRAWLVVVRGFVARAWQEYMYPVSIEATLTTREMVS